MVGRVATRKMQASAIHSTTSQPDTNLTHATKFVMGLTEKSSSGRTSTGVLSAREEQEVEAAAAAGLAVGVAGAQACDKSRKLLLLRFFSSIYIIATGMLRRVTQSQRAPEALQVATAVAISLLEVPVNNTQLMIPVSLKVVGEVVKRLNSITRRKDGTINRQLADLLEIKVAANERPVNGVSSRDVVIDETTNVWARVFIPDVSPSGNKKLPVLVYYHGGGFGVLCANMLFYDRMCRRLARTCEVVVVSVNYRRAPEHKFPIAYDDSFKALEWLQSPRSASQLPPTADVSCTFLCGDSAGGNIVHFMGCRAAQTDLTPVKIRGMILLQPYLGSEARVPSELNLLNVPIISVEATDWHWKAFLPEGANRDHPACNVFGPYSADISGLKLPPIFVVVSNLDVLVDHQLHYVRKIEEMGKNVAMRNYDGGVHGFYFLEKLGIKLTQACINDINEFLQSCLLCHE